MKNLIQEDTVFMKRCIELAQESLKEGNLPFGALIAKDSKVVEEAKDTAVKQKDITGHAEVNVIRKVLTEHPNLRLSECTLFTNFEPCAMCSFVIRDVGIGRVVFAVTSPHLGGYSRWDILSNTKLRPEFTTKQYATPPLITHGVMEKEVELIFGKLLWKMHKNNLL